MCDIERRSFLQGALAVAGVQPLCCITPLLPPGATTIDAGKLTVSLEKVPELKRAGSAFAVVDEAQKVNVILIHVENGRYVALDRSCTHGGAQCTYNAKRRSLRCTSLNHAEYDLAGTLLHGRKHGNLRSYETMLSGSAVEVKLA